MVAHALHKQMDHSATVQESIDRFLEEICAWVDAVLTAYPEGFESDSHDGGTFMTPWSVYVGATGDIRPVEFMRRYRDAAKQHFGQSRQWVDGYWRRQEAHHGTEHFDLFLYTLWRLGRDDVETIRHFEDAAEHIGNWKVDVPPWYDWERGVFRSMYLGTEFIGEPAANVPEHIRFITLALKAHAMTGRARYLEFACHYGSRWSGALLTGAELPVALDESGGIYELGDDTKQYRKFAGQAPPDLDENASRAENLIASGAPDAMLWLWKETGEERYLQAAERIVDVAADALSSSIAWQAHAAVRRYSDAAGRGRYDDRIRALTGEGWCPMTRLTLIPDVVYERDDPARRAMGMRSDKPYWLDQDGAPAPSPLLWALCGLATGDRDLLTRAVDLARCYFILARQAYGDVAHHGCGSRSLSAVARGHGRLNGAGVVTEVLSPTIDVVRQEGSGGRRRRRPSP